MKAKTMLLLATCILLLPIFTLAALLEPTNTNSEKVFNYTYSSSGFSGGDTETLGIEMPESSLCLYTNNTCSGAPGYCEPTAYPAQDTSAQFSVNPSAFFSMGLTVAGLNALANGDLGPTAYFCVKETLNYTVIGGAATITPITSTVTCEYVNHSGNSFAYTESCNTNVEFTKIP